MFGGRHVKDHRPVALVVPVAVVGVAGIVTAAAFGPYVLVGYFAAAIMAGALLWWKVRRDHRSGRLDLHDCPTQQIGYGWQLTTLLLDKSDPAGKLWLAQVRQAYLDELHRRDPHAVDAWVREMLRGNVERPDIYLRSYHESTQDIGRRTME